MEPSLILLDSIRSRTLPDGSFVLHKGGRYRPDANAWAIIGLVVSDTEPELIASACLRLLHDQQDDGKVVISKLQPLGFWPTALAAIAWQSASLHTDNRLKAIEFLLNTTQQRYPESSNPFVGHDPNIGGWPWIENTHSWVEPTSLVLLALEINGYGNHERAREGRRMLMDRQLPSGGWNYGNKVVFGQELRPMPESTGMSLCALSGRVSYAKVEKSIVYLRRRVEHLLTPLSLGWGLLGLGAWGAYPKDAKEKIQNCIHRQKLYGDYDTHQLALLLVALFGLKGFPGVNDVHN